MAGVPSNIVLSALSTPPKKALTAPLISTAPGMLDGTRSGGGGGGTPAQAEPLVRYDFENGDTLASASKNDTGFSWAAQTNIGGIAASPLGDLGLEFNFNGDKGPEGDATAEQRYELGGGYAECYEVMDLYIPANFKHRALIRITPSDMADVSTWQVGDTIEGGAADVVGKLHAIEAPYVYLEYPTYFIYNDGYWDQVTLTNQRDATTAFASNKRFETNNNKFWALWTGTYSGNASIVEYSPDWSEPAGDYLGSTPLPYATRDEPAKASEGATGYLIAPEDLGTRVTYAVFRKKATALGASDGVFKIWKNGVLVYECYTLDDYVDTNNVFERGYLLGYVNSGFKDLLTQFYVHLYEFWGATEPPSLSAGQGQGYTALMTQDFANTTVGADATADLEWYNATYTDEQSRDSGRALKLVVPSFEVDVCPTIWSDWYFGNRITLPQIVTKGHTLWMRLWLFIPTTFSWGYVWGNNASDEAEYDACAATHGLSTNGHDGNTTTKWLSFDPDVTNGRAYLNVPAARRTLDPSTGNLMLYSEQSQDPAYDYDYAVPMGRWVSHQLAVHLQDDNTGWMRFWEDDTLVAEKLNIQTLDASDTGIVKAGLGNYWNGLHYTDGQPGRDTFYLADVIFATDMPGFGAPTGVDANGNAYIPTSHTAGGFS